MKKLLLFIIQFLFLVNNVFSQKKSNYQIDINRMVFNSDFDTYNGKIDYKGVPFYIMNIGTDFGTKRFFLALRTGYYNQKFQSSERINGNIKFNSASKQQRVYAGLSYYYKWFISEKVIIKSGMSLSWIKAKSYSSYQTYVRDSVNSPYNLIIDKTGNNNPSAITLGINNSIQYFVTPSVFINGSIESNVNMSGYINDNISWVNLSIGAGYFFNRNK